MTPKRPTLLTETTSSLTVVHPEHFGHPPTVSVSGCLSIQLPSVCRYLTLTTHHFSSLPVWSSPGLWIFCLALADLPHQRKFSSNHNPSCTSMLRSSFSWSSYSLTRTTQPIRDLPLLPWIRSELDRPAIDDLFGFR
ncbi:uncharacterized protein BO88DRAFT_17899 [Aspergillus vadensis CBS 113365]|uniref:Uncharacterized protein n=1 Tax=Aspergillus vadensis (strain CBS 113365 / IMI 142717 / IBT 24658) TaxID=1448311 RepID=A0A319BPL7_ASPVC|nr:hypothetical protein BO88DRAFT_17899 [Aspergillus vadensis CBS 113365]PYH74625.1 hypothetical protein BO88DRAFT_17899 [Aspergillus vadensis CBS 113365]